jgi:SAM-dependent methyltransferase
LPKGRAARRDRLARTFDRSAVLYERGRPSYPNAAIRFIASTFHLGPGSVVLDLAAGTGKLTRSIEPIGASLVAVEPMAGMRREFRRRVPEVPVLNGTAEAIPLPTGFADAVVVGQAFHWFRGASATREIARVLRPGGALVLIWNTRDERVRLLSRMTEIIERAGGPRLYHDQHWRRPFRRGASRFTGLKKRTFSHSQEGTLPTMIARTLSTSLVAASSPSTRRRVAQEVRTLFATDPRTRGRTRFEIPYRTEVFYCRSRVPRAHQSG